MSRKLAYVDQSPDRSSTKRLSLSSTSQLLRNVASRSSSQSPPESHHSTETLCPGLPSESSLANIPCILPSWTTLGDPARPGFGLSWYSSWVAQNIASMPSTLLSLFLCPDSEETAQAFMKIWNTLATFLSSNPGTSIDEVVRHLSADKLIPVSLDEKSMQDYRSLVFTLIGWQTMLFRGDCGSCPPSQFAIADELNGYKGHAHMKLTQSQAYSREPLDRLLLQFGMLLPAKNYNLAQLPEHKQAFNTMRDVDASTLNASLLARVGRFELIWTDCLACHLELDLISSRLYLFRYPSFCLANIATSTEDCPEKCLSGPLYSCAQRDCSAATWAKAVDVSDLLEEILMSYRLLFGQNKRSRQLFREMSPFEGSSAVVQDHVLSQLCGRKQPNLPLHRAERKRWDLCHDFPILRSRLSTIAYEMSIRKAQTWSQLWQDKRDSAQWATFWTVLIFGLVSILLSVIQVILQIIALVR